MKRVGNIIPLICTQENVNKSVNTVLRGTKRKKTKSAKYILAHKQEVIDETIQKISEGSFRLGNFYELTIHEGYKERDIQILSYKDRIAVNAIMNILDDILVRRMIYTTASSIKGRGAIYLKNIIQRDMRRDPIGTSFCYKIDITKYYHNIDHDLMKECIRKYIKDRTLLPILDNFVDMLDKGLSIGLRASQVFGNLFLGWLLDNQMKNNFKIPYYYRYCDDIVILGPNKDYLWEIHQLLASLLIGSKLSIKPNYRIFQIDKGLDYLGFVIYSGVFAKVRKRIKLKAKWRLRYLRSKNRRQEIIASIKGYCINCNGFNLFKKMLSWKK